MNEDEPTNLSQLINQMSTAAEGRSVVRLEDIVEAVGSRSFGPLLLVAGLIAVSPLSGIPGVPTTMSALVLLISGQMICRRRSFWLPEWLMRRSVSRARYDKALRWLRKPASCIDRFLRPRLPMLIRHAGFYLILTVSILVALSMPLMEAVPFAATSAGFALTGFGLALIAKDGVVALISLLFTFIGVWAVVKGLF